MRRCGPLPLLVAGATGLILAAFVVVPVGPPAAGGVALGGASNVDVATAAASSSWLDGSGASDSNLYGALPAQGGIPAPETTPLPAAGAQVRSSLATAVGPQARTAVAPPQPSSSETGPARGPRAPSIPSGPSLMSTLPCPIFPSSNVWNKDVSSLPVASNSTAMINAIGLNSYLHPDFDTIGDGIPYNVVDSGTPRYTVSFDYADESDPGPYPIPANPKIEGGSDRHMLLLDKGKCMLYELYAVSKSGSTWSAGSGAIWNLRSNALRPAGWTSADAAGLPILPGLVLYSEVASGVINHAIRFTASSTCGYIYPARHQTAAPCPNLPPMGLRVRLKASVDISGFGPQAQVVLTALKRYGMILADNGSPWYISGEPNAAWNDDQLHKLQTLTGTDFEVVDTSGLVNG
jgi:hypothetical protein